MIVNALYCTRVADTARVHASRDQALVWIAANPQITALRLYALTEIPFEWEFVEACHPNDTDVTMVYLVK